MTAPGLIAIPAWNEEESLPQLLEEVLRILPDWDVLVIDDGSQDATAEVASRYPVAVLSLPINMGVGGALRTAFRYARQHKYSIVVQVDADGQHPPEAVPLLAAQIHEGADLVIGARFAGVGDYQAGGIRRAVMAVLAGVLSPLAHTKLTDPTSGFKACGPRAIALFAQTFPQEYLGDTVEALVIAGKGKLDVRQVPVAMRARSAGTPSHAPFKSALMLLRALFATAAAISQKTVRVP